MKYQIQFLFILIFTLCISLSSCQQSDKNITFKLHDGSEIALQALAGKWIIINYWSAWCSPCREEIVELNRLAKHQQKLKVFGFNFDRADDKTLMNLVKEFNIKFPLIVKDPLPKFGISELKGLPATLIISPQGKFFKLLYGPQTEIKIVNLLGLNEKAKPM